MILSLSVLLGVRETQCFYAVLLFIVVSIITTQEVGYSYAKKHHLK